MKYFIEKDVEYEQHLIEYLKRIMGSTDNSNTKKSEAEI